MAATWEKREHMTDVLFAIGNIIALIVSLELVAVTVAYGFFFRWRKTSAGTAVFIFLSALSALILLNVITLWLGKLWLSDEETVRNIIRIFVYIYAGYAVTWLAYALFRGWRRVGVVLDLERRASHARDILEAQREGNS